MELYRLRDFYTRKKTDFLKNRFRVFTNLFYFNLRDKRKVGRGIKYKYFQGGRGFWAVNNTSPQGFIIMFSYSLAQELLS